MISIGRLLVLGMLNHGPMHGHQIRREAELRDMQDWAGVKPGALYGTLNRLAGEGLVEIVSTERDGRLPARTVYAITDEGRKELGILLTGALQDGYVRTEAFDVALLVADALPWDDVAELIARRAQRLAAARDNLVADRQRLKAQGQLGPVEEALMRHGELRLEAELAWHREFSHLFTSGPPVEWSRVGVSHPAAARPKPRLVRAGTAKD